MANQRKEHYHNTVGLYSVGYNAVADIHFALVASQIIC